MARKKWRSIAAQAASHQRERSMTMPKQDLLRGPFRTDGRIIVSYPKSGRTWLRYALVQFGIDATMSHAGTATNRRHIGRPAPGIPPQLADLPLVFLHRNAIDTAVSMFYQIHKRDLRPGSGRWFRMLLPLAMRRALPPTDIDRFVLHPAYGLPKICRFNQRWLEHLKGRSDCLILKYEDMRASPSEEFQRLLDFFAITDTTGAALAEASSFDRMKAVERHGGQIEVLKPVNQSDPASAKVRRGKVEGYHDELRPETVALCQKIVRDHGF
jgi:hypothetical protein